ncbi:MAG: helix-turn-helix transcriptional regulator [Afipia sp.]|nr:helix-turn-helix transcriptional regulator [Afipia sp.]
MQKSLKSAEYSRLIDLLVAVRKGADVRQETLAKKLGKPQSFIAKYENGERRLDVVEFITIARALGADPTKLFKDYVGGKGAAKTAPKRQAK